MAKNGFKIIDSDMHVMEPPDLWEKYIDKKYRDRAPRGVTSKNVRDLRLAHPDGGGARRHRARAQFRGEADSFRRRRETRLDLRSAARSDGPRRPRHCR